MMLPGVEIARKRRIHSHEGPHMHGHVSQPRGIRGRGPLPLDHSSMAEPVLAARIRLEDKLRGSASASTPPSISRSRWSQFLCDGANIPGQQNKTVPGTIKETTSQRMKPVKATTKPTEIGDIPMSKRSASKADDDLCAVCVEKVTQLPCYHKL